MTLKPDPPINRRCDLCQRFQSLRLRALKLRLSHSIVFGEARVSDSTLDDAVVGHQVEIRGFSGTLNVGDHATVG